MHPCLVELESRSPDPVDLLLGQADLLGIDLLRAGRDRLEVAWDMDPAKQVRNQRQSGYSWHLSALPELWHPRNCMERPNLASRARPLTSGARSRALARWTRAAAAAR